MSEQTIMRCRHSNGAAGKAIIPMRRRKSYGIKYLRGGVCSVQTCFLVAVAEEAEQIYEQVDEVKV